MTGNLCDKTDSSEKIGVSEKDSKSEVVVLPGARFYLILLSERQEKILNFDDKNAFAAAYAAAKADSTNVSVHAFFGYQLVGRVCNTTRVELASIDNRVTVAELIAD